MIKKRSRASIEVLLKEFNLISLKGKFPEMISLTDETVTGANLAKCVHIVTRLLVEFGEIRLPQLPAFATSSCVTVSLEHRTQAALMCSIVCH